MNLSQRIFPRPARPRAGCPGRPHSRRSSFSLIELLVVCAVILLLLGILLNVTKNVMENADRTKAAADAANIAAAVNSYFSIYGKWPSCADGTTLNAQGGATNNTDLPAKTLYHILAGGDGITGGGSNLVCAGGRGSANPKNVQFIKGVAKADRCGTAALPAWVDPWGTLYNVAIDYNYDGQFNSSDLARIGNTSCQWAAAVAWGGSGTDAATRRGALVWSSGPNKTNNWGSGDDVRTW